VSTEHDHGRLDLLDFADGDLHGFLLLSLSWAQGLIRPEQDHGRLDLLDPIERLDPDAGSAG